MFLGIAVNIIFLNFFQGLIGARFAVICLSIEKAVWCFFSCDVLRVFGFYKNYFKP